MVFGTGAFTEKILKALERENVEQRTRDVQEKCEMLKDKARERSNRLEDAVELFTNEDLLNKHAEIDDEIRAIQEFGPLIHLGQKMYVRQPSHETREEMKAVLMGCQEKVHNHSMVVNKVVESGKLLSGPSYVSEVIAHIANLTDAWNNLQTAIEMQGNQFFFKVAKVEIRIGDKNQSMKGAAYSKDEDNSVKLLDNVNHVKLDPVVTQVNNSIYS